MNTRSETNLKEYFSGPSTLNMFFYILKNKNKKWKNLERKKSGPEYCYGWTFDFLQLLGIVDNYDKSINKFTLTKEGERLYSYIKDIDDSLLYNHIKVNELKIIDYNIELLGNIGLEKLDKVKEILVSLIEKSKGFILIKEILEGKEYIIKKDLYLELSNKLNTGTQLIGNRVPSMIQLAIFLDLFILEDGKIKKNTQYFIGEIYERKKEDKKINILIDKIKEEKTIDEINNEIKIEENKGENKKNYYIVKRAKMLSRNTKLALLIKERANYICESCGSNGFETKYKHGNNYMEAHHLKELAYGGEDKGDNMVCLCIECHGKIHHGSDKIQNKIYKNLIK